MEIVSCNEMGKKAKHNACLFLRFFFGGFNVCELSDKRKVKVQTESL